MSDHEDEYPSSNHGFNMVEASPDHGGGDDNLWSIGTDATEIFNRQGDDDVAKFINSVFEGAILQLLPFGAAKIFKTQGLFPGDAPIKSLVSFVELSQMTATNNLSKNFTPLGASLFQGNGKAM